MKRWLRHHRYALRVAVRRLFGHGLSSLANILVIALMLVVPLLGAAALQSAQPLIRQLAVTPELTLFLTPGLDAEAQQALQTRIRTEAAEQVAQVRLISATQAMDQLRADPTWAQAFDALPANPLPDTLIVTLKDTDAPTRVASALMQAWQQWPGVDRVQLDSDWVRRLESLLALLRTGLTLLSGAVLVVVLATVFNTVRLQALTQREEIAAARLVGATEPFVRRPFLYVGALTGLAAGLLAWLLAGLALIPLNRMLERFTHTYGLEWALHLPALPDLLAAGALIVLLGAVAARLSVTPHTRF